MITIIIIIIYVAFWAHKAHPIFLFLLESERWCFVLKLWLDYICSGEITWWLGHCTFLNCMFVFFKKNILCIKTITSYHLFLLSSCPIWSYRILQWPCLEMHRQMGSATFLVNATDFDYLIISHVVLIHITSQSFA